MTKKTHGFADALDAVAPKPPEPEARKTPPPTKRSKAGRGAKTPSAAAPKSTRPDREGAKHVGGYYDPAVSRQLRIIAVEEDRTVQDLIAEALDMLFVDRRKAPIATKVPEVANG